MEFKFKRKYTSFFVFALILHTLVLAFWVFTPKIIFNTENAKKIIALLALINCELILVFYLGLFRKKYFAYHDKLIIKRSFFRTLTINYKQITNIKENANDTIFLNFGSRGSFKIHYKENNKQKKYLIRSDNNNLLLKVIKNEIEIAKSNNIINN